MEALFFLPHPSYSLLFNIQSEVAASDPEPPLSEERQKETDGQTAVEHSCSPVRQRQAGVGADSRVHLWQVRPLMFSATLLPAPQALRTRGTSWTQLSLCLMGRGAGIVYSQDRSLHLHGPS